MADGLQALRGRKQRSTPLAAEGRRASAKTPQLPVYFRRDERGHYSTAHLSPRSQICQAAVSITTPKLKSPPAAPLLL